MDAAPIVSRGVNSATGALGTVQSGEIGMLRREDYLIQYEALADQDSCMAPCPKPTGPGVEQNADNAGGLTLDPLRGEAFIDRARTAPFQSCKRPSLQRRATNS
jgi:hypothetical protein